MQAGINCRTNKVDLIGDLGRDYCPQRQTTKEHTVFGRKQNHQRTERSLRVVGSLCLRSWPTEHANDLYASLSPASGGLPV
jgi:hypothetical protein